MKIFLCVFIVVGSGFLGIKISSKYSKNYDFYSKLHMFFNNLKLKIAFFKNKYEECLSDYLTRYPKEEFYIRQLEFVKTNNLNYKNLMGIMPNINHSEKEQIANFIGAICMGDYANSEETINAAIRFAEENKNVSKEQMTTKSKVIQKIAICIGLVISIIIY